MLSCCRHALRKSHISSICTIRKLCSLSSDIPNTGTFLNRLDTVIAENTTKVHNLLIEHKHDIDKVKSKFDIVEKEMNGDVKFKRRIVKNGEMLEIKFNCSSEVSGFDDDDGYDRIVQLLEMAEEKNMDYSDKMALGEDKEGIEIDVYITKRGKRLTFNCIASDKIVIQKVYFDSPLSLLGDSKELQRLYHGPKYVNLDEPIRDALQLFLRNRLVDDFLSSFICNYSLIKRERETIKWVENIRSFVN